MFDEVPPSSTGATPTQTATPSGGGSSGPSSRGSKGRIRSVQKNRNSAKNSNNASNGHSSEANKNSEAASDSSDNTSDLEDALGSPNESTTALIRKVRRKSELSAFDQQLLRIVGQHLHDIGLQTSAEVLMAEAGTTLIHPTAANFKKMVLNGDWTLAVKSKFF